MNWPWIIAALVAGVNIGVVLGGALASSKVRELEHTVARQAGYDAWNEHRLNVACRFVAAALHDRRESTP